jgi:hypothetical protein
MNAILIRTLAATAATAALATLPLAAHADRYGDPLAPQAHEVTPMEPGGLTREQVREELRTWKSAGMLPLNGEITETREVLEARQTFNELQTEVLQAEYAAAEAQLQALAAEPMEAPAAEPVEELS